MAYRNEKTITVSFGGLGCFLLFLLFLGLKLGKVIDWSWWWVTAPIWIPWGLTLTVALALLIVYFIIRLVRVCKDKTLFGKGRK